MIGVVDVEIQAANPQMPLYPFRAFVNSPSSVRVRNVPTEIGAWKITSVRVVVAYPDSSIKTVECVPTGSVWVATVAGCAVSGAAENGFTVFASGVDENGNAVSNYCLGKGNVEILKADGTLSPDAPSYYVHLFDEQPTAPNEGDIWQADDGFVIWHDGEAHALGGGSITVDSALSTTSENPVQNKVVTVAVNAKCTVSEAVAEVTAIDWAWTSNIGTYVASERDLPTASASHVGEVRFTASNLDYVDATPGSEHWDVLIKTWVCTEVDEDVYDWGVDFNDYLQSFDGEDSDKLTFYNSGETYTARKQNALGLARLVDLPTKTSQLQNDGSDGVHPFLTSHQTWSEVKPSGGIPATDLASAVQTSLGKADTAVQPAGIAGLMPKYSFDDAILDREFGETDYTLTAEPYSITKYTATSTAIAFSVAIGLGVTGKARDCILVIDCTATGAVAPTVTWDTHFHPRTDAATDLAIVEAGKRAVFYISEYAPGEFAVGGWVETAGGSGT